MTTSPDAGLLDLFDLRGRTAIVTGGAMGIGKSIATYLARAGASVMIADHQTEAAELTAKELHVTGLDAAAVAWRGGIDILVNNAGIFPVVPVLDMSPDAFDRVLGVGLRGVYSCSRLAAAQMVDQGRGGRIIIITSVDALHPSSVGLAHYDASKHGVWGFTKNLALELAPHHIWVNALAPGAVATPGVAAMQTADTSAVDQAAMLERSWLGSRWAGWARPRTSGRWRSSWPVTWPPT